MNEMLNPANLKCRKPRGQGASRRGEILAAAKHLFAVEGVAHVTMRRIGAAVGVSPTALYMHFADKDAMLTAIAQDTFSELLDRLEHSQVPGLAPCAQFRIGLRAYIEFGLERPDEYRLTFMNRSLERQQAKVTDTLEMADRSFAILQDRVTELTHAGLFNAPGSATQTAEAIWAMLHGVTALLLDQADHLRTPRSELIDAALELLEAGLVGLRPLRTNAALQDKPC